MSLKHAFFSLAALILAAPAALSSGPIGCGGFIGPLDHSGEASSTTSCWPTAEVAERKARKNLDTLITASNGYTCDNGDCSPTTCQIYVTYLEAGQPIVSAYESPAGCWQATASYTSGKINVGCSACDPI